MLIKIALWASLTLTAGLCVAHFSTTGLAQGVPPTLACKSDAHCKCVFDQRVERGTETPSVNYESITFNPDPHPIDANGCCLVGSCTDEQPCEADVSFTVNFSADTDIAVIDVENDGMRSGTTGTNHNTSFHFNKKCSRNRVFKVLENGRFIKKVVLECTNCTETP